MIETQDFDEFCSAFPEKSEPDLISNLDVRPSRTSQGLPEPFCDRSWGSHNI
jgi:hypothetical protein